jgi:hypothetical protein
MTNTNWLLGATAVILLCLAAILAPFLLHFGGV